MRKGVESAQMSPKPVPGIDLLILSPCTRTKVVTTHRRERLASTKRKLTRAVRVWVQTLVMVGEVDLVEKSNKPLPLYPLPRSRPKERLIVRERFLLSRGIGR